MSQKWEEEQGQRKPGLPACYNVYSSHNTLGVTRRSTPEKKRHKSLGKPSETGKHHLPRSTSQQQLSLHQQLGLRVLLKGTEAATQ